MYFYFFCFIQKYPWKEISPRFLKYIANYNFRWFCGLSLKPEEIESRGFCFTMILFYEDKVFANNSGVSLTVWFLQGVYENCAIWTTSYVSGTDSDRIFRLNLKYFLSNIQWRTLFLQQVHISRFNPHLDYFKWNNLYIFR